MKKTAAAAPDNALKQQKTLTFGKTLTYGLGIFGIQMLVGYINTYQSQFYSKVLNADLMICAVIILVAKIISSFFDPVIGRLIDASHFKSGKMKPFVAFSILPFAIITFVMFLFIPFPNNTVKYVYIAFTTVLWNILMSFADIPSQGMLAVLTPSAEEKSGAAGLSNMLKSVGLIVPGIVVPIVCGITGSPDIGAKEYMITAVTVCVLAILFVALMLSSTKEVVKSEPQKMSISAMFNELLSNKPLLIIFLINIVGFGRNLAVNIGVQTASVVFKEGFTITLFGNEIAFAGENLQLALGIGSSVTSFIGIMIAPMIAKRLGVKKTFMIFGVYGLVASSAYYLMFVFGPDFCRSFWGIFIGQFVISLMFGTHGYAPLVMLSDSVDYREMTTGKRTEGLQYSVLTLSVKLANALSVAVGIFIVGLSGFKAEMANTPELITAKMTNTVTFAYWMLPGICVGLTMIPMAFYTLDRPEIREKVKAYMENRADAEQTGNE
ncbi:MAG: MFS transporter [Clostridia bacterium]|nr:MFS transporter [Clostridia bacterium]